MKKIIIILSLLIVTVLTGCDASKKTHQEIHVTLNPGVDTIEIHTEFTDSGITAQSEGKNVQTRVISNTVDGTRVGRYEVVYEAYYTGYATQITRVVHVVDTTPPHVTLNPGIDTIKQGNLWTDAGITAIDNSLQAVSITIEGTVDTHTVGSYIITYIATDPSGNTTRMVRHVHVIE